MITDLCKGPDFRNNIKARVSNVELGRDKQV